MADVLEALTGSLDRFMVDSGLDRLATMVQVSYHPGEGILDACIAGHPPPLMVLPGGEARFLDMEPLPPDGCRLIDEGLQRRHAAVALRASAGSSSVPSCQGSCRD